ncbi:MAG: MarR family transcriptional regulator [Candidatus Competibacter denitrificans]|jgi:DNA-binding MarR family transcriptional regulator
MEPDNRHPTPHFAAWACLLRTHKILLEKVQKALSDAGLPPLEWYDLLLELDLTEEKRLRLFDLGERIVLSRSNLTRLCDRLEKEGLISREQCSEDRRGLYAMLSKKGSALRKQIWPVYRQAMEEYFAAHLTQEEARLLADLLLKARGSMSES